MSCSRFLRLLPCWPGSRRRSVSDKEQNRIVTTTTDTSSSSRFCKNRISTAKYTWLSFLPKFFYAQFRQYANIFFLFVAIFQQIPDVSPTGKYTTLFPLCVILFISGLKEVYEDYKRHRADDFVNNSKTEVLSPSTPVQTGYQNIPPELEEKPWKILRVGEIVRVKDGQSIPADLILLKSSDPKSICYIETSNLDGETNLKLRQCVSETSKLAEPDLFGNIMNIECEPPNRHLTSFFGVLELNSEKRVSLKPLNLLLRGSSLKNTDWVVGIIVYTGHETKIMMNSASTPLKQSSIEKITNKYILLLFGVLIVLAMITFIANVIWTRRNGKTTWYLGDDVSQFSGIGLFWDLLTSIILYNTIIPISLPVMLEVVRTIQAAYINSDKSMRIEDTVSENSNSSGDAWQSNNNTNERVKFLYAMARTSNLNEELGQVRMIFSDKTGTLTRNEMVFKQCSIAGELYGNNNPNYDVYKDDELLKKISARDDHVTRFFQVLAVCHTVVPEKTAKNTFVYRASSPDEEALVRAGNGFGFKLTQRSADGVVINQFDEEKFYEVLNVIDFTSERKRMSVVVRLANKQLVLMVKGADNVIQELVRDAGKYAEDPFSHVSNFASAGLRTLYIAWKTLSEEFYTSWSAEFHKADTSIENRDEQLARVAAEIENDLELLGVTAIEDKLQADVPETIADLLNARISMWMLTGDKQQTAKNIGFSCRLLDNESEIHELNSDDPLIIDRQLQEKIFSNNLSRAALITDGKTLEVILKSERLADKFITYALQCLTVICCRVSPWQKAQIVLQFRKKLPNHVSLAIGDGANDVGMIQAANVGVGIIGKEGRQAASASDYAIWEFRHIKPLLLVHGAWNYNRIVKLILYSFYKNVCLYLIQFYFAFHSGFSGQVIFERWTIGLYNVIFTAAPPMALGLFDRSTTRKECLQDPKRYANVQIISPFNLKVFVTWMGFAVLHSFILYFAPYFAFGNFVFSNGQSWSLLVLGNSIYTYVVVTVCAKAGLEHSAWTLLSHLAIWGSILVWFIFLPLYSRFYPTFPIARDMVGMDSAVYGTPVFWFGLILFPPMCLAFDVAFKVFMDYHHNPKVIANLGLSDQHPA